MTMTMMTKNSESSLDAGLAVLDDFFSDYSAFLLSSGCTTLRIEKNVRRMAARFGVDCVMTVMPKHIEIMLSRGGATDTRMAYWTGGINFYAITALSRLSWKVADGKIGLDGARRCLAAIKSKARMNIVFVTFAAALANASFCRLFRGDAWAMLFVFIATLGGFCVKNKTIKTGFDARVACIIAGCLSAIIACGPHIFGFGTTPDVAVATSVLYLVPGIPFINAFSDFINGHYVCSMSRLLSALETTVCLGTGLVLADYILKLQ